MQGVVVAQGLNVLGSLLLQCSLSDLLTLLLDIMLYIAFLPRDQSYARMRALRAG